MRPSPADTSYSNTTLPGQEELTEEYVNHEAYRGRADRRKKLSMSISAPSGMSRQLPTLQPARPRFISVSLPCSESSTPRYMERGVFGNQAHPLAQVHILDHQLRRTPSLERDMNGSLVRSKSCGDGRSSLPPDEFDICIKHALPPKPVSQGATLSREGKNNRGDRNFRATAKVEGHFTCGALCMFVPKGRPHVSSRRRKKDVQADNRAFSRTISLEKFECGSWAAVEEDEDDDDDSSRGHHQHDQKEYYELPMELIMDIGNDTQSPVNAAFVFEDKKTRVRTKSHHQDTERQVRFSSSSQDRAMPLPSTPVTMHVTHEELLD